MTARRQSADDTRLLITARFLFSTKEDADCAADLLDRQSFVGQLAVEILIEEA